MTFRDPKVERKDESGDLIARGEQGVLELRAMRTLSGEMPAMDWYKSLEKKGIGQLKAVVSILETSFLSGRPPAGRSSVVPESRNGLIEIRVTSSGADRGPHLRLFAVRRKMRLYAALGITKKSNKLKSRDKEAAERVADQWVEREKV